MQTQQFYALYAQKTLNSHLDEENKDEKKHIERLSTMHQIFFFFLSADIFSMSIFSHHRKNGKEKKFCQRDYR